MYELMLIQGEIISPTPTSKQKVHDNISADPFIQFTLEREKDRRLPFLDLNFRDKCRS